jgi:acetyl-CoA carboxylase biotin carboxyl carrier protein
VIRAGLHDGVRIATGRPDAEVLDELCQAVVRLARACDAPPALLRIRLGSAYVELRWPTGTPAAHHAPAPPPVAGAETSDRFHICAPMVGTFYHASEPGAQPYVRAGDVISAGQQVGVLEAMKLFNPVHGDQAGRVVELLVPDGSPVEYGQPLIACTADVDR